jgi:hypothetical protein
VSVQLREWNRRLRVLSQFVVEWRAGRALRCDVSSWASPAVATVDRLKIASQSSERIERLGIKMKNVSCDRYRNQTAHTVALSGNEREATAKVILVVATGRAHAMGSAPGGQK